jgi:hypothetical protein
MLGTHERCIDVHSTHASSDGRLVPVQTSVAWRALCQLHDGRHRGSFALVPRMRMIKKRHRSRRWWVHPINSERYLRSQLYTLYLHLREDSNKFCNYFRKSAASFDELLCHTELCGLALQVKLYELLHRQSLTHVKPTVMWTGPVLFLWNNRDRN